MYGTVARMRVKAGASGKMQALMKEYEALQIPGYVNTVVYQMDNDANELYMVTVFENKEAYVNNANDPAQHERFLRMMEALDGEPEWHDGEVIYQMK